MLTVLLSLLACPLEQMVSASTLNVTGLMVSDSTSMASFTDDAEFIPVQYIKKFRGARSWF